MDAKAERVVHNQLVNVTCKDEAGQYVSSRAILIQWLSNPNAALFLGTSSSPPSFFPT